MSEPAPECPVCRVRMEEGHVLDARDKSSFARVAWIEGPPEKGGLRGYRIKGRRQIPVMTWRCPRCGWLLWFAPEPAG
jgi:hypothetical protein